MPQAQINREEEEKGRKRGVEGKEKPQKPAWMRAGKERGEMEKAEVAQVGASLGTIITRAISLLVLLLFLNFPGHVQLKSMKSALLSCSQCGIGWDKITLKKQLHI